MKYITKYKSPNYNSRNKSKIKLIIIHYTALNNSKEAISYLCTKENKVSAHYLISQGGLIYYLVNERFRAWHAGQSYWQNIVDINSYSIGIELDYNPNGKNNKINPLNPIKTPKDLRKDNFSSFVKKCASIDPLKGVVLIKIAAR